jgi:hypothetical protein
MANSYRLVPIRLRRFNLGYGISIRWTEKEIGRWAHRQEGVSGEVAVEVADNELSVVGDGKEGEDGESRSLIGDSDFLLWRCRRMAGGGASVHSGETSAQRFCGEKESGRRSERAQERGEEREAEEERWGSSIVLVLMRNTDSLCRLRRGIAWPSSVDR